jgi:hypothetical protein
MQTLLVTGDFERGRAAREEERKAHHMKKSDTEAELKRLRAVNAELLGAAKMVLATAGYGRATIQPRGPLRMALGSLLDAVEKAEHS